MKRIGILAEGGDAPGLNAVIRRLPLALEGLQVPASKMATSD